MPDQPLRAFSPPESLASFMPDGVFSAGMVVQWLLYIVFAFWALYTLIAVYHWLKYSHASWLAFPAIGTHIFISIALMAYALPGAFIL